MQHSRALKEIREIMLKGMAKWFCITSTCCEDGQGNFRCSIKSKVFSEYWPFWLPPIQSDDAWLVLATLTKTLKNESILGGLETCIILPMRNQIFCRKDENNVIAIYNILNDQYKSIWNDQEKKSSFQSMLVKFQANLSEVKFNNYRIITI